MSVSTKTLTIDETFFQEHIKLSISLKNNDSDTILNILNDNNISINQSCGGNGTCGTCRIEVTLGENISDPTEDEKQIYHELQLKLNQRLACQTKLIGDAAIRIVSEPL